MKVKQGRNESFYKEEKWERGQSLYIQNEIGIIGSIKSRTRYKGHNSVYGKDKVQTHIHKVIWGNSLYIRDIEEAFWRFPFGGEGTNMATQNIKLIPGMLYTYYKIVCFYVLRKTGCIDNSFG